MPQKDVVDLFICYLRNIAKLTCSIERCEDQMPAIKDRIILHLEWGHPSYSEHKSLEGAIQDYQGRREKDSQDRRPTRNSLPISRCSFSSSLGRDPDTRLVNHEDLVAEVKRIYAGLVMVESKCIEVDNDQSTQNDDKLDNEQWQAPITSHRALFHEHHNFILAPHHPPASPTSRCAAPQYATSARLLQHRVHAFLELLEHHPQASLNHMLTFIYLEHSMMALLYETVPGFEDAWIECLGDLGRTVIEGSGIDNGEVWGSGSRRKYLKASTTGGLCGYLASPTRLNALQQLYDDTKSYYFPGPLTLAELNNEILLTFEEFFDHIHKPRPIYDALKVAKHKRTRRGRGKRRNAAYWKSRNNDPNAHPFDERELLFRDKYGGLKISRLANLDTQLKIDNGRGGDLIMSSHCARELGLLDDISTDFEDPCLQSISGYSTAVMGVLHDVQFRLRGGSVTFRRNFWVCDAIDGIIDIMIGASFIEDNFKILFGGAKECVNSFATWFPRKKETLRQNREREILERQQKMKINELEIKRLQRENQAHQRANELNFNNRNEGTRQGGTGSGGLGGH